MNLTGKDVIDWFFFGFGFVLGGMMVILYLVILPPDMPDLPVGYTIEKNPITQQYRFVNPRGVPSTTHCIDYRSAVNAALRDVRAGVKDKWERVTP